MATKVSTAPATEPLSTTEVKLHLKVDYDADDTLISSLITAARELVEEKTNLKLITQTVEETFDRFPCDSQGTPFAGLRLTFSPLISVTSVKYQAEAGTYSTLGTSSYTVHSYQKPPVITPAYNTTWPTVINFPESVKVTYQVGYGAASAVPDAIKAAMLLMIGHWYENRQDTAKRYPSQADWILQKYKICVF